eukprot:2099622-Alexandrium_andersonii.AAC.1
MAVRPNPSAAPSTIPASSASPELRVSRGPRLDGVQSAHAHSPARGPPSQQTPGKVRVDVRAESGPFGPPRK